MTSWGISSKLTAVETEVVNGSLGGSIPIAENGAFWRSWPLATFNTGGDKARDVARFPAVAMLKGGDDV